MADQPKTFLYNAHGSALGGFITRPFQEVIESVAHASLAVTGGYGSARVSNYKYHELITIKEAYTQVSGSQSEDGSYNTLVSTTIEGLNVADMITADRVVARITTKHDGGEGETRVAPTGSEFVNLRIAGEPLRCEYDSDLSELDTFARYKEKFGKTASQSKKGMIRCSLIKNLAHSRLSRVGDQEVIVVPDFGTIYLGEVYMEQSSRRLTMMRLELGSPVAGSIALGGGSGNGLPYP
jgi:hypothetical protein